MKKQLITLSLCATLCLSTLAACDNADKPHNTDQPPTNNQSSQIPNPFVDYDTLAEAEKAAGLEIYLPENITSSDTTLSKDVLDSIKPVYRAMDGEMLEIIYYLGDDEIGRVRKALGSEDISGDNNSYDTADTVTEDDNVKITLKGNKDKFYVATWSDGGYAYSVAITDGLAKDTLLKIVKNIK